MTTPTVLVLGATGMLGSMVLDVLDKESNFELIATTRRNDKIRGLHERFPKVQWRNLDARNTRGADLVSTLDNVGWIINCIGVIKPYIKEDNEQQISDAIAINASFPHYLSRAADDIGATVLQIATDCVYSGTTGSYRESTPHDALDVYGKTKSLGEPFMDSVKIIRCSIIGPEPAVHCSLLDWFRGQPDAAKLKGFTNHFWNGVSTLHFARVCRGIIEKNSQLPRLHHLVPGDQVDKAELLRIFAQCYTRTDLEITDSAAAQAVDRTLATQDETLNAKLWHDAGYSQAPGIAEIVGELAAYDYRLEGLLS